MADGSGLNAVEIGLDAIVVSDATQLRKALHQPTVNAYAKAMAAGSEFPPVVVWEQPKRRPESVETFLLIDGFHRVEAARLAFGDRARILAEIVAVSSTEQARWLAARANLRHGLRFTTRELRHVFRAYVGAGEHREGGRRGRIKSYRQMAAELGVRHTTLRLWMQSDFPSVFRAMSTGGLDEGAPAPADGGPVARSPIFEAATVALESVRKSVQAAMTTDELVSLRAQCQQVGAAIDEAMKSDEDRDKDLWRALARLSGQPEGEV